jgi:hypothetical protein
MSNKVKKVCKHCGGDNVWKDASARFNTTTQEYELSGLYDAEYCDDCDVDTEIVEAPLP